MGRFTGVALALALIAGCAAKSEREAGSTSPAPGGGATVDNKSGTGAVQTTTATTTGSPKVGAVPPPTNGPLTQAGPSAGSAQPLDPSAHDDPSSPKQQARATGVLGDTNQFDDTPIGGDGAGSAATKGKAQRAQQPAFTLDTPDDAVKAAVEAQRAKITGCKKTATGVLEIALTVDANGKITSANVASTSTLKDRKTSDCVVAIVKKLALAKGTKVSGPIKITF